MKLRKLAIAIAAALATAAGLRAALAAADQVVIVTSMTCPACTRTCSRRRVEAINMAIADFGGTVLGKKIVTLTADHQNKPDIGASKFRQWRTKLASTCCWRVQHRGQYRHGESRGGKEGAILRHRRGWRVPDQRGLHGYTVHYVYDTTSLANGTATAIVNAGGKTCSTSGGLCVRYAAAERGLQGGGGARRQERRCGARTARAADFSSFLLQPRHRVHRCWPGECRHRFQ